MTSRWKRNAAVGTMVALVCAAAALNWRYAGDGWIPGQETETGEKILGEATLVSGQDGGTQSGTGTRDGGTQSGTGTLNGGTQSGNGVQNGGAGTGAGQNTGGGPDTEVIGIVTRETVGTASGTDSGEASDSSGVSGAEAASGTGASSVSGVSGQAALPDDEAGFLVDEEAVYSGADYFASARLTRQQARDSAISLLQEAAGQKDADQSVANEASEGIQVLAACTLKEAQIENLVTAKGYQDCVAFVGDDSVSVVVSTGKGELSGADVARITDIAMSETGLPASGVKILAAN